jgi:3-oxo-5-alpha-steroid 4-dehydrogenase 1
VLLQSPETNRFLAYVMFAAAAVTFAALWFITAPYGRHVRKGWGPTIPERVGWMVMESPSLIGFLVLYLRGAHRADTVPILLCALWLLHYGQRVLIYPFRIKGAKRMPVAIALLAICFNALNISVNAPGISSVRVYAPSFATSAPFLVGVALFLLGFWINLDSDRRLFALRKPGETGYTIPHGGLFEYITSPNYFGEIVEWTGWAIASWSLGGAAFAVYTFANLAPRAVSHRRWYRTTFPDYPVQRKAVVPFVM